SGARRPDSSGGASPRRPRGESPAKARRPPRVPSLLPPERAHRLLHQLVGRVPPRPASRPRVLRSEEDGVEEELLQLVEERARHLADIARLAQPGSAGRPHDQPIVALAPSFLVVL